MSTIKSPNEPNAPHTTEQGGSINEPPGSTATNPAPKPEPAATKPQADLPSDAELHKLTRAELDDLAEERDVDVSGAANKDEVIELLRKDARKRK